MTALTPFASSALSHAGVPDVRSDPAPLPYTADELQEATRVGRTYTFLVEAKDNAPKIQRFEFTSVDGLGASVRTSSGPSVSSLATEYEKVSTWGELANHGMHYRPWTTIEEESIELPAGTFKVKHYTIHTADGVPKLHMWYAVDVPGPPIKLQDSKRGEVFYTMILQSFEPGPPTKGSAP